jgi:hypothetical protein
MKLRYVRVMLLGLILAYGGMACAPKLIGPTVPSGYFFSLQVSDPKIWLMLDGSAMEEYLPRVSELTVQVQNAQGQPVDDILVTFQVESDWTQDASVTPHRAMTRGGVAQGIFSAKTTGVVRIMVRVDDTTQETRIVVTQSSGGGGGDGGGGS